MPGVRALGRQLARAVVGLRPPEQLHLVVDAADQLPLRRQRAQLVSGAMY